MSPFTLLGTIKIFVKKWNPNFKKINKSNEPILRKQCYGRSYQRTEVNSQNHKARVVQTKN